MPTSIPAVRISWRTTISPSATRFTLQGLSRVEPLREGERDDLCKEVPQPGPSLAGIWIVLHVVLCDKLAENVEVGQLVGEGHLLEESRD
jgi:hypothetical protein